jgi:hypothetical protein
MRYDIITTGPETGEEYTSHKMWGSTKEEAEDQARRFAEHNGGLTCRVVERDKEWCRREWDHEQNEREDAVHLASNAAARLREGLEPWS